MLCTVPGSHLRSPQIAAATNKPTSSIAEWDRHARTELPMLASAQQPAMPVIGFA
jgi:hypothetical protein